MMAIKPHAFDKYMMRTIALECWGRFKGMLSVVEHARIEFVRRRIDEGIDLTLEYWHRTRHHQLLDREPAGLYAGIGHREAGR